MHHCLPQRQTQSPTPNPRCGLDNNFDPPANSPQLEFWLQRQPYLQEYEGQDLLKGKDALINDTRVTKRMVERERWKCMLAPADLQEETKYREVIEDAKVNLQTAESTFCTNLLAPFALPHTPRQYHRQLRLHRRLPRRLGGHGGVGGRGQTPLERAGMLVKIAGAYVLWGVR
ncbi:hypothetical protein P152DRAFT_484818 [Eremomyces bilateralis CBS 781.70]|uniref:Uncharacterized protein n=1 Tax=Eremomyces bilateralis CBS 781.70 TaxID=1392243 RepID=A0A6G1FU78_9PEZI|nr:uncharacterized protein P152DRAFT_484818 [Eremomyces bilateralis CBS 781.70]KAF1809300.1 hypothetical protein P152DRAFT_484818 [Eremomyces bilateralis CBS 781.70]